MKYPQGSGVLGRLLFLALRLFESLLRTDEFLTRPECIRHSLHTSGVMENGTFHVHAFSGDPQNLRSSSVCVCACVCARIVVCFCWCSFFATQSEEAKHEFHFLLHGLLRPRYIRVCVYRSRQAFVILQKGGLDVRDDQNRLNKIVLIQISYVKGLPYNIAIADKRGTDVKK